MSNATTFVKLVALLGVIVILTAALTGSGNPQWDAVQSSITAGVDFPEFLNPFSEQIMTYTSLANPPSELVYNSTGGAPTVSFVGCDNTTADRISCINGTNRSAYMQVVTTGAATGRVRLSFNFTNPFFTAFNGSLLRTIRFTVSCHTTTPNDAFPIALLGKFGEAPTTNAGWPTDCPVSEEPRRTSQEFHQEFILLKVNATGLTSSATLRMDLFFPFGLEPSLPPAGTTVRVDYVKIEIGVAQADTGCKAPEGAWLPWADEIACAIGRFADFVWKGIQFLINGITFVLVTVAVVLIFIGGIISNLVLGVVNVAGTLFNLGAPSPVQEMIDVLVIVIIAFILIALIALIRGGEG